MDDLALDNGWLALQACRSLMNSQDEVPLTLLRELYLIQKQSQFVKKRDDVEMEMDRAINRYLKQTSEDLQEGNSK